MPLHVVGVATGHVMHVLAEQYEPAAHACPQLPQLFPSLRVSMHAEPHAVSGVVQMHAPALQVCPVGHECPQLPQLVALVLVFAQYDSVMPASGGQAIAGAVHLNAHPPATQEYVGGQTLPQVPQLLASVIALVHVSDAPQRI